MEGKHKEAAMAAPPGEAPKVEYSMSGGLVRLLSSGRFSIAFTSYQSGILYTLGLNPNRGVQLHQSAVAKPMGLSHDAGALTLTSGYQVIRYENVLAPHERVNALFDACFMPRMIYNTGQLDAHDVGIDAEGNPVFVNTRFNCLAVTDNKHSFRPIWRPPFITDLVDEDRCHLNGLAMRDGHPAYVTAVSRSNTIDGWRDRRADGGVVIDVRSDEIVCEGLSMPHSPRLHGGELWLQNSGTGELGVVKGLEKGGKGVFEPRVFCPGFLRGLSFHGNLAFVGLSKPRYKRFDGLALADRLRDADSEPWCGVQIIDVNRGSCVEWFRIDGAVAELYDVEVIPGIICPMAVSPASVDLATLITYEGRTRQAAPSDATETAEVDTASHKQGGSGRGAKRKPATRAAE